MSDEKKDRLRREDRDNKIRWIDIGNRERITYWRAALLKIENKILKILFKWSSQEKKKFHQIFHSLFKVCWVWSQGWQPQQCF